MQWFHAIILGLVQGLAEFLPVSSSGHLILFRQAMSIEGDFMVFDIVLHAGTLLAVAIIFYKDLISLFKPPFKTLGLLALASIPAALIGFFLSDIIDKYFYNATYLCFFFLISAIIMFVSDLVAKTVTEPKEVGLKASISMGLMQSLAVLPGVTRSGTTILGGLIAKGERSKVAKFSFFMSAVIILGAAVVKVPDLASGNSGTAVGIECYILGTLIAFLSGLFAIKVMLKIIAKADFKWFSLYLLILSIVCFFTFFLSGIGVY